MTSEMGVLDRSSTSSVVFSFPTKRTLHTRALSLLSSLRPGSSSSKECAVTITTSRSVTFPTESTSSNPLDASCTVPSEQQQGQVPELKQSTGNRLYQSRSFSHRRMRWSASEGFQKQVGSANQIPNEFLGVAVTTVDDNSEKRRDHTSKQKTMQILRNYHRPTQINQDFWSYPDHKDESFKVKHHLHHHRGQASTSTAASPVLAPFQGNPLEWSPALLPAKDDCSPLSNDSASLYSHHYASSSSTSLESATSRPCTPYCDGNRQVWRVSSTDEEPKTTFDWL